MHCIVGVIHEDPDMDVDSYFDRFLFDNTEYFEMTETLSPQEVDEEIAKQIEYFKGLDDTGSRWETEYYLKLMESVGKEQKRIWGEYEGWVIDEFGGAFQVSNPNGECDWFEIGGRWDGSLVDFDGERHNTLKLRDINLDNPHTLTQLYGVVRHYNDENFIEYCENSLEDAIAEPLRYCETNEKDLYMTLVDMHY